MADRISTLKPKATRRKPKAIAPQPEPDPVIHDLTADELARYDRHLEPLGGRGAPYSARSLIHEVVKLESMLPQLDAPEVVRERVAASRLISAHLKAAEGMVRALSPVEEHAWRYRRGGRRPGPQGPNGENLRRIQQENRDELEARREAAETAAWDSIFDDVESRRG